LGICDFVTKPRIEAAITGLTPDRAPIEGDYKYVDEFPIAAGLDENVVFFTLDYLDPNEIELGQSDEVLKGLLWLVAGGKGEPPDSAPEGKTFAVLSECGVSILFDDNALPEMIAEIADKPEIEHVFLMTVSEDSYAEMSGALPDRTTHMWPRDYLRFFRKMAEGAR
jgi:adenine-specific DNA-methyltransferase